jgi:hypothetical protein
LVPDIGSNAQYFVHDGGGYLLYRNGETLLGRPFDARRLQFTGEPVDIEDGVGRGSIVGLGNFSISSNGILAYSRVAPSHTQLAWLDRNGRLAATAGNEGPFTGLAVSWDEKRVALSYQQAQNQSSIWHPNAAQLCRLSGKRGDGPVFSRWPLARVSIGRIGNIRSVCAARGPDRIQVAG